MRKRLILTMLGAAAYGYAGSPEAQAADPFPDCTELGIAGPADIGRAEDRIAKFRALGCKDIHGNLLVFPSSKEAQASPGPYAPAPPKADAKPYTTEVFRFSQGTQF